ncbi:MAG: DUF2148 domain-containing protein [Candidatus Omnitrophica bacterium]|nr:DUF2148 domain-containing protein [Candidatus Omnitrophota bacterium]
MKKSSDAEREAIEQVANLMGAAARTAPKTCGIDNILVVILGRDEIKKLVPKMIEISMREKRKSFDRDAHSTDGIGACVVIGAKANPAGLDCGYCGFKNCAELRLKGGICAYNSMDLGIALSSAAGIASNFHIDNRLMFSIGKAAMELGLFGKEVRQAIGIPLSITGKSPFFDRT